MKLNSVAVRNMQTSKGYNLKSDHQCDAPGSESQYAEDRLHKDPVYMVNPEHNRTTCAASIHLTDEGMGVRATAKGIYGMICCVTKL